MTETAVSRRYNNFVTPERGERMKRVIYLDVLIAVNLFINYFLLLAVAAFLRIRAARVRLIGGAALGAVYSLIILLPPIGPAASLFVKLLMSATIVLAAFGAPSLRFFLRTAACFYLTGFAFAGFMLAVWYFVAPQGMLMKNSVVYFDISPLMLFALTVVCYGAVRLLSRVAGRWQPKELFCSVTVQAGGKTADFTAKVDTGNTLTEPFSGFPVVVAEYGCVERIVPDGVRRQLFAAAGEADRAARSAGLRLVPFHAVGGGGILPAFQPDLMVISTAREKITVNEVYLAVTEKKLCASGFGALLNPQLLTQGRQTARKEKRL